MSSGESCWANLCHISLSWIQGVRCRTMTHGCKLHCSLCSLDCRYAIQIRIPRHSSALTCSGVSHDPLLPTQMSHQVAIHIKKIFTLTKGLQVCSGQIFPHPSNVIGKVKEIWQPYLMGKSFAWCYNLRKEKERSKGIGQEKETTSSSCNRSTAWVCSPIGTVQITMHDVLRPEDRIPQIINHSSRICIVREECSQIVKIDFGHAEKVEKLDKLVE